LSAKSKLEIFFFALAKVGLSILEKVFQKFWLKPHSELPMILQLKLEAIQNAATEITG
jgi:hypothetical protein